VGGKPFFVVDADTKRILDRHGLISNNADCYEVQRLFMENLPKDTSHYNEFHVLIVNVGKGTLQKKSLYALDARFTSPFLKSTDACLLYHLYIG
jgi:endonuclease III-like uncharacterized protein